MYLYGWRRKERRERERRKDRQSPKAEAGKTRQFQQRKAKSASDSSSFPPHSLSPSLSSSLSFSSSLLSSLSLPRPLSPDYVVLLLSTPGPLPLLLVCLFSILLYLHFAPGPCSSFATARLRAARPSLVTLYLVFLHTFFSLACFNSSTSLRS